jgi:RNA polymerase sigma-70 factor (ECF subfamily)
MDDVTLIKECSRGNAKAQRALFDKFAPKMLAVCMRYLKNIDEAEDALQDGFVKVFQKIPEFKMEGSLEGWIRRIMVNNSLDAIRRNKKQLLEDDVDSVQHKVSFTDFQFDDMDLQYLMKIIQSLPDGYRVVFNMFAIEGYSHKEIAETLGVSENTSKSQYSRARALLREKLEQIKNVRERSV